MKLSTSILRFWRTNKFVFLAFLVWRTLLAVCQLMAPLIWDIRSGFLGPIPWANFDGVHYLKIATEGYYPYAEAFFPLYPLLIRYMSFQSTGIPLAWVASIFSHIVFLLGLLVFYTLYKSIEAQRAKWAVIFVLAFPTSFYFASVYTESLFFFFSVLSLYFLTKSNYRNSAVVGAFASATRLFGIAVMPAMVVHLIQKKAKLSTYGWVFIIGIGLALFMNFLWHKTGDPLGFVHVQPAFGAERTGGEIVLFPQVVIRYIRIFWFADSGTFQYKIALFEFVSVFFAIITLTYGWRKNIVPLSHIVYSASIFLVPTLSGTFSSMPRYVLSAFPLFFILGSMHNTWVKRFCILIFSIALVICTTLFLQGYFIS